MAVSMEYFEETTAFGGATVHGLKQRELCPASDLPTQEMQDMCASSMGDALGFGNCFDWSVSAEVCQSLPTPRGQARCWIQFQEVAKFDSTVVVAESSAHFEQCIKHYSPDVSDESKSVAELVQQFFRPVACTDAAQKGCCGDSECEWLEGPENCPDDCSDIPISQPNVASKYVQLQALANEPPQRSAAEGSGGRCAVIADKLPFCGGHVPYPVGMSESDAVNVDKQLAAQFRVTFEDTGDDSSEEEVPNGGSNGRNSNEEDGPDEEEENPDEGDNDPNDPNHGFRGGQASPDDGQPDDSGDSPRDSAFSADAYIPENNENDMSDEDNLGHCAAAMARELCLTAFPMCDDAADLPYCSVSHAPQRDTAACGPIVVCPDRPRSYDVPVVCGAFTSGSTTCVIESGQPHEYHDLFGGRGEAEKVYGRPACAGVNSPTEIPPECDAANKQACDSFPESPPKSSTLRCFRRTVRLAPESDTNLVDVYFASGANAAAKVLWSAPLTRDSDDGPWRSANVHGMGGPGRVQTGTDHHPVWIRTQPGGHSYALQTTTGGVALVAFMAVSLSVFRRRRVKKQQVKYMEVATEQHP